jgi:ribosome biogenesis protein BRX1
LDGLPKKWVNKQRVLVFSSRGTSFRARHLLKDLQALLPHSKTDVKLDRKDHLDIVNEVCELRNCNNCIFLETRKKQGACFAGGRDGALFSCAAMKDMRIV